MGRLGLAGEGKWDWDMKPEEWNLSLGRQGKRNKNKVTDVEKRQDRAEEIKLGGNRQKAVPNRKHSPSRTWNGAQYY